MALDVVGFRDAATRAYQWLFDGDGSSFAWELFDGITLAPGAGGHEVTDGSGAIVGWTTNDSTSDYTHVYQLPRADGLPYTAALRVIDDTATPDGPLMDVLPIDGIMVHPPSVIPAESCDGEDNDCDSVAFQRRQHLLLIS